MAKSCCGQDTCSCVIIAGDGIVITGGGTTASPMVIEATLPDFATLLRVVDSATLTLRLTGGSGLDDPLTLQGSTSIRVEDLEDVNDPGGPNVGEGLFFQSDGTWKFAAPPVTPAGSVNVGTGISGDGSVGSPLSVRNSGTWGSGALAGLGADSTIGLDTYIDSAGKIRVTPTTAFLKWANIPDKPTVFTPDPAATYTASQITDLATNGNAAKVGGHRLYTAMTSSPTPVSPAPAAGDVFLFPKGS